MTRLVILGLAAALTAACAADGHVQSPLNAAGDRAAGILTLWRVMLVTFTVVYSAVLGLVGWSMLRRRESQEPRHAEPKLWIGVGGLLVPGIVLTVLLVLTLRTMSVEAAQEARSADLTIRVAGLRWWWDVEYEHADAQSRLRTANEIHIPVGRDVRILLESRDIIHSFWVPALDGKIDMIPGRVNELRLRAERPGIFRGQCAEFCGMQHANMAFLVIAQDPDEFDAWYRQQLEPASIPASAQVQRGLEVFLQKPCAVCHAVRGTYALATVGPDLTHFASRRTLAAGARPNNRGNLGGWISNPQAIKPGSHMPNMDLTAEELQSLLAFLEQLR